MPDTEAVKKQIVGVCEEIIDKPDNDWVRFNINVGTQYPVGLSTKKDSIIQSARAVGGDVATWTYNEVESDKLNEKTGKPFINRYLEGVVAGDAAVGPAAGGNAPQTRSTEAVHQPLPIGDRERSIIRQTCLKAAGALFSGQGNKEVIDDTGRDTVSELIAAAARMEVWIMRDIDDPPF